MSSDRSPDSTFLDRARPAAGPDAEALVDGLSQDLEEYQRVRADVGAAVADPCPERWLALEQAERAVFARLRAHGWCPATKGAEALTAGDVPSSGPAEEATGSDAEWNPARAALALVGQLAAADRDSGELVERMEERSDIRWRDVVRAAQRCQGLIADALLVGAVDLAVRIGIPDSQLPL